METKSIKTRKLFAAAACVAAVFGANRAQSQQQNAPGGPPGGQFGQRPGEPPGPGRQNPFPPPGQQSSGRPMGMMMRPVTALDIPLQLLQPMLELSDEQTLKIASLQRSMMRTPNGFEPGGPGQMPGPGGQQLQQPEGNPGFAPPAAGQTIPGGPQPGFQGDPEDNRNPGQPGPGFPGQRPQGPGMRGGPHGPMEFGPQEQGIIKGIYSVLTASQKKALPGAIKQFEAMQKSGIPMEVLVWLKLTAQQREKINAFADAQRHSDSAAMEEARSTGEFQAAGEAIQKSHQQFNTKVMESLTTAQRQAVRTWFQNGPGNQPGFPGGQNRPLDPSQRQ